MFSDDWSLRSVALYTLGGVVATGAAIIALVRARKSMTWGYFKNAKDLQGKIYVITGANTGIGLEVARTLVAARASVILACRSRDRGLDAAIQLKREKIDADVSVVALDLASLDSVRKFANLVNENYSHVDGLVCNAGLWVGMKEERKTADGFEIHFGTNHLGHYLLADLLEPSLKRAPTGPARVVMVSSELMLQGKLDMKGDYVYTGRITREKSFVPTGYSDSKLLNALMCKDLADKYNKEASPPKIVSHCTSPGFCYTELQRNSSMSKLMLPLVLPIFMMVMRSAARGAMNVTFCLLADGLESGTFYRECKVGEKENAKVAENEREWMRMKELSEELVKEYKK